MLSESAYNATDRATRVAQEFLTGVFVNGLLDEYIKRRLLEENPPTLNEALELAMMLQNSSRTVEFSNHQFTQYQPPQPQYQPHVQ